MEQSWQPLCTFPTIHLRALRRFLETAMKRNELFNLFEQEYPLECRTFKAFRFSLLLTSVSFIHHRIDIRLHNSTASEEQGLESLADSSAKRDIRSLRVSNEREKERERESSRRYRSPSFSTFSANLWRYYRAVVDVVAPLGSTVPPFPAVSSFLQTGLAVWYRSTVEAHELFSRLCPWENTRVAPVGIVNAAANCARRRRPLAWILNIAFFRHRYRPFPSPNPQPLYRTLSASVSDSASHLHPAVFLFLLCSSINREIFSFHYGWLDGLVPTAIFREQTLAGRSPLPQDLAFELFPA